MVHEPGKYRVRRGDSLWKIASHQLGHGSLWRSIAQANHLRPNATLLVGQFLTIPRQGPAHHAPAHAAAHPSSPSRHSAPVTPAPVPAPSPSPMPPPSSAAGPGDEQANRLARPVFFPKFQYKLEQTILTVPVPGGSLECKITADLSVQQQGVITAGLTLTQKGMEAEYKVPADNAVRSFFSSCTASIEGHEAKLTLATGAVVKMGNRVLATTQVELGPSGPEYVYKGEELKFSYRNFDFAGQLGYRMSYRPGNEGAGSQPSPSGAASSWPKTVGTTLVLGAIVLVVVDALKDAGTFGAGAAETPLSWMAAYRMYTTGTAMMRMVTP